MSVEALRVEVEQAVAEYLDAGQPVDRAALLARYTAKGASRTRIYAWIKDALERLPSEPRHTPEQSALAADLAALPDREALASIEVEAKRGGPGSGQALERLQALIDTANKVLNFALHPDGRVKNPRLALIAVEQIRRMLETSLKLYETISNMQTIERFIAEVMAELRAADPEMAKRVVERMQAVQGRWAE